MTPDYLILLCTLANAILSGLTLGTIWMASKAAKEADRLRQDADDACYKAQRNINEIVYDRLEQQDKWLIGAQVRLAKLEGGLPHDT